MNNPVIRTLMCCFFIVNADTSRGGAIPDESLPMPPRHTQAAKIKPAARPSSCVVRSHLKKALRKKRPVSSYKKRPVKTAVLSIPETTSLLPSSVIETNEKTFPVAKTSTGKFILLANQQHQLVSWNTEAECPLYFDGHHDSEIIELLVSPNDRFVLSSSFDRKVRVWDFETGKELAELAGNEREISAIALTESGVIAALGSIDGKISIWDLERKKKINIYENKHASSQQELHGVSSLAVSIGLKGQWMAVGDRAGWVSLWDIRDGHVVEEYKAFKQKVRAVKLTPGGDNVVAGGAEGQLLIWNKLTHQNKVIKLNQNLAAVEKVDISPDGQYVLAGDQAGKVYLIEMDTGIVNYEFKVSGSNITLASFNNNEEATIVDSEYQVWRLSLENKQLLPINDVSWSAINPKSLSGLVGQNWQEPKTGTQFIWVPASCFDMGCKYPEDEGCAADNMPFTHVCLDGYWMAKQMVSKDQWLKVMGYPLPKPEVELNIHTQDVAQLATGVSWFGAQGFACKMNRLTGYNLTIPSEAEWEKVCRNADGQQIKNQDVNAVGSMDSRKMNIASLTMENMNESINEWILDFYYVHGYHFNRQTNPVYLTDDFYYYYNQDIHRVKRGGGWDTGRTASSCITRQFDEPESNSLLTGFRIIAR